MGNDDDLHYENMMTNKSKIVSNGPVIFKSIFRLMKKGFYLTSGVFQRTRAKQKKKKNKHVEISKYFAYKDRTCRISKAILYVSHVQYCTFFACQLTTRAQIKNNDDEQYGETKRKERKILL